MALHGLRSSRGLFAQEIPQAHLHFAFLRHGYWKQSVLLACASKESPYRERERGRKPRSAVAWDCYGCAHDRREISVSVQRHRRLYAPRELRRIELFLNCSTADTPALCAIT